MSCKDGQYPHQMQSHQQNFALLQLEMDSRHAYFQNSPIVHHLACIVVSMENLESVGCRIFGFCLLWFPQNKRKIYKLRQLSLSQFVLYIGKCDYFSILNDKIHNFVKKNPFGTFFLQKGGRGHVVMKYKSRTDFNLLYALT